MKKVVFLIMLISVVLSFSGCVPTAPSDLEIAPDFSGQGNLGIDFTQLNNDAIAGFSDPEPYSYVTFVEIGGSEAEKKVTARIGAMEDEEGARYFAAALLKNIAAAASMQDPKYSEPTDSSFGGFWDTYAAEFSFYGPEDVEKEGAEPFFVYSLAAGEKSDLDPDTAAYEDEYHRVTDLIMRNEGLK